MIELLKLGHSMRPATIKRFRRLLQKKRSAMSPLRWWRSNERIMDLRAWARKKHALREVGK